MPFGIIVGQLKDVVRARGDVPDLVGVNGGRGGVVARLRVMRRYSFEAAVGRAVRDFGSEFILSPLTDPGGLARAACFHLAAGGSVGEHEATGVTIRQFRNACPDTIGDHAAIALADLIDDN